MFHYYLATATAVFSIGFAFVVLMILRQVGMVDVPNARSSHARVMLKGGGLLFCLVFVAWNLYWYQLGGLWADYARILLVVGPLFFSVGWVDDRLTLKAGIRLVFQVVITIILLMILTRFFTEVPQLLFLPNLPALGLVFLFLYLVWFINLYNFMDGGDGIAAGVGVAGSLGLSQLALFNGAPELATIYIILAASLVGFLWLNWYPAKLFMGDSGAYFLGSTLVTLSVCGKINDGISLYPTIIVFGYFIVDATYTLIQRVRHGHHPFHPHQQFSFHKLFNRGWNHGKVASLLIGICLLWLFPMAWLSTLWPKWSLLILVVAYLPLICFEVYIGAGKD